MTDRASRGYSIMTKRSDFLVANRGKRQATPGFVLLVFDRRDSDPAKRLGITITKKVGNAVVRNRMRRRFRALAAEMLGELGKAGADHILIGRDGGIERDFAVLREEMARALGKLCALRDGISTSSMPPQGERKVETEPAHPEEGLSEVEDPSRRTGSGLR